MISSLYSWRRHLLIGGGLLLLLALPAVASAQCSAAPNITCNDPIPPGDVTASLGSDTIVNNGTINGNLIGDDGTSNPADQGDHITNNGTMNGNTLGRAGNDTIINNNQSNGNLSGAAGDDSIVNNGTLNGAMDGGVSGGNDTLTNNGTINGNILGGPNNDTIINNGTLNGGIDAEGDDDRVILQSGNITGNITGGAGIDTLQFAFSTNNAAVKAAFDAAFAAFLVANPACNTGGDCSGSLMFGSNTYNFNTFEQLQNLVTLIGAVIENGGGGAASAPTFIELRDTGQAKAFMQPGGDIDIYSGFNVSPPNGFFVARIVVSQIPSNGCTSIKNPTNGWSVEACLVTGGLRVRVFDDAGALVSEFIL